MLDFNHGANKPTGKAAELTARVNRLVDHALEQRADAPRDYLGASIVGNSCARQTQYDYQGAERVPFTGQTLRIFQAGHLFEAMTAVELKAAGFDLRTKESDGAQFGFSVADGRIRGHIDGVIVGGPNVGLAWPALWEHKALGPKSWTEVVKKGVAAAKPVYAAQIALYQVYMDLTGPALFTARNRDTQQLYHEPMPFDAALAQKMSDRAVDIIKASEAGELLPRIAKSQDFFECRWCDFAKTCWGDIG